MIAVKGFFNGDRIVMLEKPPIKQNQKVIVTILDEYIQKEKSQKPHREFMGMLDNESCREILDAIKDCEKVDIDEW